MKINYDELLAKAKEVSKNAYAPYSNFPVGACVLFENGNMYTGCNVENASYGLSLCAERNAISTAVAAGEKAKLVAIAIVAENMLDCPPCGACRQWIYEFSPDAELIFETKDGYCTTTIKELLPKGFVLNTKD
ncbi:MAG: cytidine deaminase [Candidatus Gastranaerophilales bacterium]|nr:cytidine deaminase [Candidatus Gastranaerophilales bacterium]